MKTLTVFTPTYNRKHTLPRTYESLCRQTSKDFEWLVIDDGSSDGTREWIEGLGTKILSSGSRFDWMGRAENEDLERKNGESVTDDHFVILAPNVRIEYVYKPNGGLYTGYNVAYQTIQTELCVCIDSDDYMPDDAVEKIVKLWNDRGDEKYCGLTGLDFDVRTYEPIGGYFAEASKDIYFNEIGHVGDTKPVFRSELLKKISPMTGFEGEKDFNPHYMQMQVYDQYPVLLLNDNLCWVEYQIGADSMSQGIFKQYLRSPRSYAKYRLMELKMKHGMNWKRKIMLHIHFVSSCLLSRNMSMLKESPNWLLTFFAFPLAFAELLYIRMKVK